MVFGLFEDRDARVVLIDHQTQHLAESLVDLDGDHLAAACHRILDRLVAKLDNALEHLLLFFVASHLGSQLHCLAEILDSDIVAHLICQTTVDDTGGADKKRDERTEHHRHHLHHLCHAAGKRQRLMRGIDLWHDFAEKQKQESEDDSLDEEDEDHRRLVMVDDLGHEQCEQCDDGDVDKIVANEDSSHQSLRLLEQAADDDIVGMLLVLDLLEVGRTQREKSYLGSRYQSREHQQKQGT